MKAGFWKLIKTTQKKAKISGFGMRTLGLAGRILRHLIKMLGKSIRILGNCGRTLGNGGRVLELVVKTLDRGGWIFRYLEKNFRVDDLMNIEQGIIIVEDFILSSFYDSGFLDAAIKGGR